MPSGIGCGPSTLPMLARRLVAEAAGDLDLAEVAGAHPSRAPRADALVRAALRAGLDDAVVFARRLDHLAAFPDVVRDRLLDVDVLARLAGPDDDQRMPVVRRGDGDGVDVLVFEQLADIGVGLHRLAFVGEPLRAACRACAGRRRTARRRARPASSLKALMWLPPRPPKPTTATRMSSLAPATCAHARGGGRQVVAAVVSAVDWRKLRRFMRFMALRACS